MKPLYILPSNGSLPQSLTTPHLVPTFGDPLFFFVQTGQSGRASNVFLVNADTARDAREMVQGSLQKTRSDLCAIPFSLANAWDRVNHMGFAGCLAFVAPVSGGPERLVDHLQDPKTAQALRAFLLGEAKTASGAFEIGEALASKCVMRPDGKAMIYAGLQATR